MSRTCVCVHMSMLSAPCVWSSGLLFVGLLTSASTLYYKTLSCNCFAPITKVRTESMQLGVGWRFENEFVS